jgi:hypothetical protein
MPLTGNLGTKATPPEHARWASKVQAKLIRAACERELTALATEYC